MPQELHVVKCYHCRTFQVDIIKKVKKWTCKMCGEKQSLIKVFGTGSGKDCRELVQHLNLNRVSNCENDTYNQLEDIKDEPLERIQGVSKNKFNDNVKISKWNEFLPKNECEKDSRYVSNKSSPNNDESKITHVKKKLKRENSQPTIFKNNKGRKPNNKSKWLEFDQQENNLRNDDSVNDESENAPLGNLPNQSLCVTKITNSFDNDNINYNEESKITHVRKKMKRERSQPTISNYLSEIKVDYENDKQAKLVEHETYLTDDLNSQEKIDLGKNESVNHRPKGISTDNLPNQRDCITKVVNPFEDNNDIDSLLDL